MNGDENRRNQNMQIAPEAFIARSLDEIRFWSRIMKEHSLFLRLGFRCEDTELIDEANQYYRLFENIEQRSHSFTNPDPEQIRRFNSEVQQAATGYMLLREKF